MTAAFPLHWPRGRLRAPAADRRRATFNQRVHNGRYSQTQELTVAVARDRLFAQLDWLGAGDGILSTNVPLLRNGQPRSDRSDRIDDPGAALYFTFGGRQIALACDRWDRVADNIAALAKHIEAMRGMARWGVGSLEQAFEGYQALPPAGAGTAERPWWEVLGIDRAASNAEIEAAWREAMRAAHPDRGGDPEQAKHLNVARDQARKERTYHG